MSLCDTCVSPGACCKRLFLYGGPFVGPDLSEEDAARALIGYAAHEQEEHGNSFPFAVVGRDPDKGDQIIYTCPALGHDGRCTIYDRRPSLCRNYEPGSDPLCVHYTPPTEEEPHGA